jgi:hypothetical protein
MSITRITSASTGKPQRDGELPPLPRRYRVGFAAASGLVTSALFASIVLVMTTTSADAVPLPDEEVVAQAAEGGLEQKWIDCRVIEKSIDCRLIGQGRVTAQPVDSRPSAPRT